MVLRFEVGGKEQQREIIGRFGCSRSTDKCACTLAGRRIALSPAGYPVVPTPRSDEDTKTSRLQRPQLGRLRADAEDVKCAGAVTGSLRNADDDIDPNCECVT